MSVSLALAKKGSCRISAAEARDSSGARHRCRHANSCASTCCRLCSARGGCPCRHLSPTRLRAGSRPERSCRCPARRTAGIRSAGGECSFPWRKCPRRDPSGPTETPPPGSNRGSLRLTESPSLRSSFAHCTCGYGLSGCISVSQ